MQVRAAAVVRCAWPPKSSLSARILFGATCFERCGARQSVRIRRRALVDWFGEASAFKRDHALCEKRYDGCDSLRWIEGVRSESDDAVSPITMVENEKQKKDAQEREDEVTKGHERPR
jgi:hypothetical protein